MKIYYLVNSRHSEPLCYLVSIFDFFDRLDLFGVIELLFVVLKGLWEGRSRCHVLRPVEVLLHHMIKTLSIVNKLVLTLLELLHTPLFLLHFVDE